MILRSLDLLFSDPIGFIFFFLVASSSLVLAITVHEFSHALVASGLGDTTPRRLGRLSLNPLVHLDPLGSVMLLLVGFGWGKPVPVNAWAMGRNVFRGMAMVAFAGPLSNIFTAVLLAMPFRLGLLSLPTSRQDYLALALITALSFNLLLAVFNLIPLAPLDGSKVLPGLLPREMAQAYHRLEPMGPVILLGIIALDIFLGFGILVRVIGPVVNALSSALVGISVF